MLLLFARHYSLVIVARTPYCIFDVACFILGALYLFCSIIVLPLRPCLKFSTQAFLQQNTVTQQLYAPSLFLFYFNLIYFLPVYLIWIGLPQLVCFSCSEWAFTLGPQAGFLRSASVRIQPFVTISHSKLIVAEQGGATSHPTRKLIFTSKLVVVKTILYFILVHVLSSSMITPKGSI